MWELKRRKVPIMAPIGVTGGSGSAATARAIAEANARLDA